MGRQLAIAIFVLLAVIGAGVLVYTRIFDTEPPTRDEVVVCERCQNVFEVDLRGGTGGAPYVCPECGEKAAYLAYQCVDPDCGTIFPVDTGETAPGEEILCPVCQSEGRRLYHMPSNARDLAHQIKEVAP
ncbi:MAG: hypothetical protein JW889_02355 [Verrucomicrobia bacterium]|nr:hypothetical protein [Verrucomicrobiota bacterium]